jgi:hypothetical protein
VRCTKHLKFVVSRGVAGKDKEQLLAHALCLKYLTACLSLGDFDTKFSTETYREFVHDTCANRESSMSHSTRQELQ